MSTPATLEQLSVELNRIESEIFTLRQEIEILKSQKATNGSQEIQFSFVPKTLLQQHFRNFLENQGIKGQPIGAEALQEMMRKEGVGPNELSSAIISAREE